MLVQLLCQGDSTAFCYYTHIQCCGLVMLCCMAGGPARGGHTLYCATLFSHNQNETNQTLCNTLQRELCPPSTPLPYKIKFRGAAAVVQIYQYFFSRKETNLTGNPWPKVTKLPRVASWLLNQPQSFCRGRVYRERITATKNKCQIHSQHTHTKYIIKCLAKGAAGFIIYIRRSGPVCF